MFCKYESRIHAELNHRQRMSLQGMLPALSSIKQGEFKGDLEQN
jgi:hypothetical protein